MTRISTKAAQDISPLGYHPDPARSWTLSAPYYLDPQIYAQELDAIFYRGWNLVGHVNDLREAGCYATCMIGDQNIFVVRGKDGELRAFYNVCQHRGHELLSGRGQAKFITCPYHAWTYGLDGSLRTARNSQDLPGFDLCDFGLKSVQVEVFAGFIYVNLDPAAPSLNSQAGELEAEIRHYCPDLDRLTRSHHIRYEVKANWKVLIDNFLECYHCQPAHPAFVDLVEMSTYRSKTHGIYSSHIAGSCHRDNEAFKYQGSDDDLGFAAWWLWPNVTFVVYPGGANFAVLSMIPTGPETSVEHFDFYFLEAEPNAEQRAAIEYSDKVLQPEDIALCESVQRGLHSRGYHQGRYVIDNERSELSEHAVHHFHGLVLDALGD